MGSLEIGRAVIGRSVAQNGWSGFYAMYLLIAPTSSDHIERLGFC